MRYAFTVSKHAWFKNHVNDPYVKRAQKQNFRSRAAFKLQQIELKYKILNKKILDLGASPGSWCEMSLLMKPESKIVAIDLLPMKKLPNIDFYCLDANNINLQNKLKQQYNEFDSIISDMAPNFSGNTDENHENILDLNKLCIHYSLKLASPQSALVMKTLNGRYSQNMFNLLLIFFTQVHRFKPQASKNQSNEFYYICKERINIKPDWIHRLSQFNIYQERTKKEIFETFK